MSAIARQWDALDELEAADTERPQEILQGAVDWARYTPPTPGCWQCGQNKPLHVDSTFTDCGADALVCTDCDRRGAKLEAAE